MIKQRQTTMRTLDRKVDRLADAVAAGFRDVEGRFRGVDGRFHGIEARMATKEQFRLVIDGLDLVRADVADIKRTLGPLVSIMAAGERRINPVTAA